MERKVSSPALDKSSFINPIPSAAITYGPELNRICFASTDLVFPAADQLRRPRFPATPGPLNRQRHARQEQRPSATAIKTE